MKQDHVLSLVNEARTAMKLEPLETLPRGKQRDPCACVLAQAFNGYIVSTHSLRIPTSRRDHADALAELPGWRSSGACGQFTYVDIPAELREFVLDFDSGYYPSLIEAPA